MMLKVEKENFELQKIKLLPGGGTHVECKMTMQVDGSFHELKDKLDNPIVPHPDLENPIRGLKEMLLISCNFMGIKTLTNSADFKATKAQKEAIAEYLEIVKSKTTVTGVHLSGQDENRGVIISGKIQAENGSSIAINSPRMRFESTVFGFEEDLDTTCEKISEEVYEYIFRNKKAQLDIYDNEDE